MRVEHIAIWTDNLERLKEFYITYFGAKSNQKYRNDSKKFESYFLSFSEGCRIEIMQRPNLLKVNKSEDDYIGLAHLAISVGSKSEVISLTERLRKDGYKVLSEPRTTGDGYFESVIADPDGNKIEITI
ncbi:MAG: glyoxalase/bleomycin resistance/extradiol dioxygenase family protein [Epulopiscium sp.]|nr:glyoxalase/bleomycin resistance/extradiol dioxygenase family protein [Candidatus Epulonipiscium sp.]